jgi:S1-C subfamily serine protease
VARPHDSDLERIENIMSSEVQFSLTDLSGQLAQLVAQAAPEVVTVHGRRRASTSGVLWKPDLVVTTAHGIGREEGLQVVLASGDAVDARLRGMDPATDIALLALDTPQPAVPQIAAATSVSVGQLGVAIGRGSEGDICSLLAMIGAVGGPWRTWAGGKLERRIRLDRTLYPGFSGGPTLDTAGNMIGVNTAGLSRQTGIVIPMEVVERIAEELRVRGSIARGYLGIATQPVKLPESIAAKLSPPASRGLIVVGCAAAGPADQGGVLIGDVLVALNGKPIHGTADVQAVLDGASIGQTVSAALVRAGNPMTLSISVGERKRGVC